MIEPHASAQRRRHSTRGIKAYRRSSVSILLASRRLCFDIRRILRLVADDEGLRRPDVPGAFTLHVSILEKRRDFAFPGNRARRLLVEARQYAGRLASLREFGLDKAPVALAFRARRLDPLGVERERAVEERRRRLALAGRLRLDEQADRVADRSG